MIRWAQRTGHTRTTLLDWGRIAFAKGAVLLDDPFAVTQPGLQRFLAPADEDLAIQILEIEDTAAPAKPARGDLKSLLKRMFGG